MKYSVNSPIILIGFNRLDSIKEVVSKVKLVNPKIIYFISDGARSESEKLVVQKVRKYVLEAFDNVEVKMFFPDNNLGCKNCVSQGISWVFDQEEKAIILEDDCVPSVSFFRFCDLMLEKYQNDERVMMVSGDNFTKKDYGSNSYYFSAYHFIWGWATWARAWRTYDVLMKDWPVLSKTGFLRNYFNKREIRYWTEIFNRTYQCEIDTWDYQWAFAIWSNNGLTICPSVNLIQNIGFNEHATHTKKPRITSNLEAKEMTFPLNHPKYIGRDLSKDELNFKNYFHFGKGKFKRLLSKLKRIFID